MGTRTEYEYITRRNPAYTPDNGAPEMLPPEQIAYTIETTELLLSKTSFNKYAATCLGSTARFQQILDDAEAASGDVKFCWTQYQAALTFEKSEVQNFLKILNSTNPKIVADQECSAIMDNWPQT